MAEQDNKEQKIGAGSMGGPDPDTGGRVDIETEGKTGVTGTGSAGSAAGGTGGISGGGSTSGSGVMAGGTPENNKNTEKMGWSGGTEPLTKGDSGGTGGTDVGDLAEGTGEGGT